jgi:hypothetical protein
MSDNLQKKAAIAPRVQKLTLWWATKRDAAEHEGSSIVGKVLLSRVALLADKLNGFEVPELLSGQPDRWKGGADYGGNWGQGSVPVRVSVNARKQGVYCRPVSLGV